MIFIEKIAQKIDQTDQKTLLVFGIGTFVVVCLLAILIGTAINRRTPGYNEQYVDKDTGETVSNFPNTDPETAGQKSTVVVLGLSELNKFGVAGLVPGQLPLMRQDLVDNALPKLGEHDEVIKIIDVSFDTNQNQTNATLKLSEKRLLRINITVVPAVSFTYRILDGGTEIYKSKQIYSDDYTGDGSPPEEQPGFVQP